MSKIFTTNTATLKATIADIRSLDAKQIKLKDKNILDYIKESVPVIKHSQDTRETITENDLWGQWIETLEDGTVIIHDDEVINPNASNEEAWNTSITKVEDNKAYVDGTLYSNIQTDIIKNGSDMFKSCSNLSSFTSDLSSLTNGSSMFASCTNLSTFTSDLSNLTDGGWMFSYCPQLTSFFADSSGSPVNLSNLTYGKYMFQRCSALTSFSSDLSSLTDGQGMFYRGSLESFESDLSSLTNGNDMFASCPLKSFESDLPSLTSGIDMFASCSNLTKFNSDLSNLTRGSGMFSACKGFTSFGYDLSSLTSGYSMFGNCSNLISFTSCLPSLTYGPSMFSNCTSLTSFASDLSSLKYGGMMFRLCSNLTTFTSDLSNLTYASSMFDYCSNLTTFTSDLSNLTYGGEMFSRCKLDAQSVMYIIHSIKDIIAEKQLYISGTIPYVTKSNGIYSAPRGFMSNGKYIYTYNDPDPFTAIIEASDVGKLTIGINVSNDTSTIQDQLQTFAEEAFFDSWADLKQVFVDKGWTVTWQYGGTVDSITYDLRGGERIIPCPVYAKLIEILPQNGEELTEKEKDKAEYCSEDGTKFYNIEWGHEVSNPDDYQLFDSLLDACGHFGVMPKSMITEI